MAKFPVELRYTRRHEWIKRKREDIFRIGITDHAQEQLGDLVFVELPEIYTHVSSGDEVGVVESVKTAADVYSPLTGEIVEVNKKVLQDPALINHDPYGDGWLYCVKIEDESELDHLLSANDYEAKIREE
ncbi:glycine cleavage system protein GcvH [Coxiella endosymbiont of Amblyomma nuttalli]|uniref:glycine cleavage system protein GcvH n=1 Tax=Coxiella endosymbiont of Amblyomma nuttalli TaxID=2749996 RepID=UPI001BA603BE|nr:glycine cleavage system protein GcvH [Coxiella endosymbiont of Amblyomma nuttalli]QTS83730.1 Glycine cleavage system H protein [Coxiella endosymbiont of Amblyomma nuttalli]